MKKIILTSFMMMFIISMTGICEPAKSAIQYDYENVTAGTGSSYQWIDNSFTMCSKSDVKDCKITVTYDDGSTDVLETLAGGKKVIVDLDQIKFENTITLEYGFRNAAGFEFLDGTKLRIIECNAYPELEGLLLDISGHIVDNNNKLTVYIPSGVY